MSHSPEVTYTWNPDEQFTISGRELGLILNTFRSILATEQSQNILLVARSHEVLQKMMDENVKNGKIIEKEQPKTE